ncbi:MAG: uracil phosphoribosyltransferase [Capnocytophaga sp.]|nr:uracil phosphoribosyltransferase [Capnocytophaga sp.]
MKTFFEAIQYFFEEILFLPLDYLRNLELENWWLANLVSWIFILIAIVFFLYWLGQLRKFNKRNEERTDVVSHSFFD